MTGALKAGSDIFGSCGKCKGDTWHVIVAMLNGEPSKVECKECGSGHKFRVSALDKKEAAERAKQDKAAAKSASKPARASASKSKSTPRASTSKARVAAAKAMVIDVASMTGPIRDYNMRESFSEGERVRHEKFGLGLVMGTPEPGKVEIEFMSAGRRVLIHEREA